MTVWPFGLLRSDAILAKNLLYGMPADALRPATDLIFRTDLQRDLGGDRHVLQIFRYFEIGLSSDNG